MIADFGRSEVLSRWPRAAPIARVLAVRVLSAGYTLLSWVRQVGKRLKERPKSHFDIQNATVCTSIACDWHHVIGTNIAEPMVLRSLTIC